MSDVEKAFPASADSTSGSSAVALQHQQQQQQQHHQQQQRPAHHSQPQQQQQQQQYYIKPTITANTHYCHETGHIKTSPSPLGTPATLRRQPSAYATKQPPHSQQPNPPPSPTASVCSSASSSSRSSGCDGDRDGPGCLTSGHHNCLSLILKLIFSTPGLVVLVVAYSIMGAFIFPMLEAPQDLSKSAAIAKSREDCLRELWIITEKLNVLYERNWTMLVHEQLRRFEGSIVAATRHGGHGGAGGRGVAVRQGGSASSTAVGRFGGQFDGLDDSTRWSFSEALLYSVTVITTIGHGSLTPKTAAGKIATILYALIGVPLMLMCLSSLGSLLAEALQCTYARICCRLSATTTASTTATNADAATTTAASSGASATRQGGSKESTAKANEKKPILRKGSKRRQRRYNSDGDIRVEKKFQVHGPPNVESKAMAPGDGCKYDALGFGTYNVASNAGAIGHNEESFHLLQPQTPIRVAPNQHNVACMQQQQHHYYGGQQRPDVMLMAHQPQHYNRSGTPSPQHSSTYHQQHQQQYAQQQHYHHLQHQQQQTYQATSSPTTITTTSSPPAAAPTMQTFQLVASSVGASTVLPHHVAASTATAPTSTARHFVAVPSGLLRFPPPNMNTNMSAANPMAPSASAAVSAATTTTIYFPISHQAVGGGGGGGGVISGTTTPAQVAFVASQSSPAGGATAAPATATVAVPYVKYHTIQFQPKKPYVLAAAATASNNADGGEAGNTCPLVPLPPPPAYQTATVHGVRRAKFLTKPLPQEINNLLAENDIDISCRHDLSQSSACTSPVKQTTGSTNATECLSQSGAAAAPTASLLGSSTTTVDIMEDEEEHEQDRIGCPHGTPSRIPLISAGSSSTQYGGHSDYLDPSAEKSTRGGGGGLINATAASFHRHTFQRKSTTRRQQQQQQPARRAKRHSCFGDPGESSEDDGGGDVDDRPAKGRHKANEQFVLTQIDAHGRVTGMRSSRRVDLSECDDGDEDEADANDYEDGGLCGGDREHGRRHVPIILVLGILVCYICLGTVIFALWENWSLIDGAYFCFVTLATIGYGDFLPERTFNGPEVQLFACCAYLLLGLVLVAMSFSILETQLLWKCKRIAVRLKLATD